MIKVGYIFSRKDYLKRNNDDDILLVTGLSGSGKSFFSKELIEKEAYQVIQLDWLKHSKYAKDIGIEINKAFQEKYPEIIPYMNTKFSNEPRESKNIIYLKYINLYFDFIIDYLEKGEKYIIEGIQIFSYIDFNKTKKYSICIKRTSSIRCILNRIKRDYKDEKKLNFKTKISFFIRVIKEARDFQFKQRKILNKYLKYLANNK